MFLFSAFSTGYAKARSFFQSLPKDCKLVFVPTAANLYAVDSRPWFDQEINILKSFGFDFMLFDLVGKRKLDVEAALKDAGIVYVCGGNTYYLLQHMKASSFLVVMENAIKRGVVYMGSSAGAAVTGPDIGYIGDLDDPSKAELSDYKALGLIDYKILPHIDSPKYQDQIRTMIGELKKTEKNLIGLRDDQVIRIDDGYMEIL